MDQTKKKIFVGNLSWQTTEEQLKEHFSPFGKVVSAKIVQDQSSGRSKGYGFIEMADSAGAEKAIKELNNQPLLERNLRVSLAEDRRTFERRDREPRGESYGSRSSYGNSRY